MSAINVLAAKMRMERVWAYRMDRVSEGFMAMVGFGIRWCFGCFGLGGIKGNDVNALLEYAKLQPEIYSKTCDSVNHVPQEDS
jgi:hypothetical protein